MKPIERGPRRAWLRSFWADARAGFRRTAYVAGPISMAVASLCLAPTAFAAGSGRGWALPAGPLLAILFVAGHLFVLGVACGGFLGATIGRFRGLFRKARPTAIAPDEPDGPEDPVRLVEVVQDATPPVETPPPRFPVGRWAWLLGLPVVLTLGTIYGAGVYVGRLVDRRLAAAISAADQDDPAWRAADLMAAREPVPDAENSALVVARAVALLPEDWPPTIPGSDLSRAFDRQYKAPENVRLDDASAVAIRRELDSRAEAIRIARTVADYRRGRHELEYGPTLLDTPLPETQASRGVARLMQVDATLRAHDGDLDGAIDSCRAVLGVGRSIGDEPFAISQLVRIAEGEVAMGALRRVIGQGEPSDATLARAQAVVLDEFARPRMLYGVKGERAVMVEIIRQVGSGEMPITALSSGGPAFDPNGPRSPVAPWGRLMFDHQQAVELEWTNRMVAIARRPLAERPAMLKALKAEVDGLRRDQVALLTTTLPLLLSPAPAAFASAESRSQSNLGATAILLAAERHRRKAGIWPASIASIDPDILTHPPLDPYTGQPFRFEHRDGQLRIYSIGPNLRDEHGAYNPKRYGDRDPDDYGTSAWDVPLRRLPPGP